jgi:hypothetical protein
MTDREDQSNLPPIPDGGLAETMPDWLRRPPAWRTLPDREVAVPEPEETAGLPEPDESVIDPRDFLSDDDLPRWLRNLGRGRASRLPVADGPDAVSADSVEAVPEPKLPSASDRPPVEGGTSTPSRFVPAAPPAAPATAAPRSVARETAPQSPSLPEPAPAPAWQGAWVVAVLAALLAVAIAIIVVLVL